MQVFNGTPTMRRIILIIVGVLIVAGLIAGIAYVVTRPSQEDFRAAKSNQITEATKAREALAPAVNGYLAAFKAAYNQSNSIESATDAAKKEYDAYKQAASKAAKAMEDLSQSRIANDRDTGTSVRQLQQDYDAEVRYYTGLVDSYPQYTGLFAKGSDGCSGVFVGESDGLADRKSKLDVAVKQCSVALDTLKTSANLTYVDYAKKVERRVKRLQADAAVTVTAEQNVKQFESRVATYQRQYDEAKARNAPDEEILKLADELKAFNSEIAENRANFDYAAKRYLDTVKELPSLYGAVYETDVPAKQKYYDQLVDYRTKVLALLVEGRIETR